MSALDNADTAARELGLDPRGYLISAPPDPYDDDLVDDADGRWVSWGAPAGEIMNADEFAEEYGDGPADPSYTVLDYLTDQAGGQGLDLLEYLDTTGYGQDEDGEGDW